MAKYQQYEEYKDSGVEWLGEMPRHWIITKTSRFFKIAMGQTILKEDLVDDGRLPVFSATEGNHYLGRINYANVNLEKGDLVIPARGNSIGFVKIVEEPSTTTQTTIYCKQLFKEKLISKYVYYYFLGSKRYLFRFTQTAIPQITTEEVGNNTLIVPPVLEQHDIINFLDYQVIQIDTLIEKQQTLIQLLKEKRQAVISHAVTKGLNPDVTMKDSGVEWLGEVPEHWNLVPLKYAVTFQRGHDLPAQNRTAGNVPLVTSAGISSTHNVAIAKAPGLVTGRYGTIGKFNLLEEDYWPLNTTLYSINLRGNNPKYLWYMLHNLTPIFLANSLKSAVPGVDRNDLHVVKVVIPKDLDEQAALCAYLEKTHCTYDLVIKKASESLILLQERRTALISAAVTGKIDVRGWRAPE